MTAIKTAMSDGIEIKCGNCRNFVRFEGEAHKGGCDEFCVPCEDDWRCDGAAFRAREEVAE